MNFVEIYKILRAVIAILGKIFSIISIISLLFAIFTGNLSQLAGAILDGASKAVTLTIALVGVMGLWSGVMRVLEDIGVCRMIAKIISPILKFIFPETCRKGIATEEVAANISANMLGLGNAATPMGIKAMQEMSKANGGSDTASNDMITFVVMNTCAISLMPTTLIALRRAAGAENPVEILIPVWICSAVCTVVAVFFAKAFAVFSRGGTKAKAPSPKDKKQKNISAKPERS